MSTCMRCIGVEFLRRRDFLRVANKRCTILVGCLVNWFTTLLQFVRFLEINVGQYLLLCCFGCLTFLSLCFSVNGAIATFTHHCFANLF